MPSCGILGVFSADFIHRVRLGTLLGRLGGILDLLGGLLGPSGPVLGPSGPRGHPAAISASPATRPKGHAIPPKKPGTRASGPFNMHSTLSIEDSQGPKDTPVRTLRHGGG